MAEIPADTLRAMISDLDGYIERRAAELAAPIVAKAQEEAAAEVQGARGLQQRAEDLNVELRRMLKVRDRQVERARERAEHAEAAVARFRAFLNDDFRQWCSPHGVAATYAERLIEVLDREVKAGGGDPR
ncbi:hypothetical protein [Nonomuraea sp. NPDC050310]|uniref:hypothetical protein n=1 Tax=Nonomuraea sp. NPDC050310 TaxID=3154935 RepID=UPI0033C3EEA2